MTFVVSEPAIAALADSLRADLADLPPGSLVAALCANTPLALAVRDACADHLLAPLNPRLPAAAISALLSAVRPAALIGDPELARAEWAPKRGRFCNVAFLADWPDHAHQTSTDPPIRNNATLQNRPHFGAGTLLFTSGTTGRPKGCVRPAAADAARVAELTASYGLHAGDVHLIACPLAHSAPGILVRAGRAVGARTVVMEGFDAIGFLRAVEEHRATVAFLVPTQWQRLLALPDEVKAKADWSSLRCAIVAGAPIAAATKRRILEWIGPRLWEFYGSTETGTVTVIGPDDHLRHPGSVGRPPPGVAVALRDVQDGVGEVYVRSAALMAGYLGEPPAADEISVGDLGRIDDGWLTLVDRKHDTIISGGVNVYPAIVERALAEHPRVAGAVAFGVDDEEWGQRVAAVVALAPGPPLDAKSLDAFLRERLAGPELPRLVAFCAPDDLPIGSSGKALRRAARAAFAAALRPV